MCLVFDLNIINKTYHCFSLFTIYIAQSTCNYILVTIAWYAEVLWDRSSVNCFAVLSRGKEESIYINYSCSNNYIVMLAVCEYTSSIMDSIQFV